MLRLQAFTLVEILISSGIISMLSLIVITSIHPRGMILQAKDTSRVYHAQQVQSGLTQLTISGQNLSKFANYPTKSGTGFAVPICNPGFSRDSSCIDLSTLQTSNFMASIPLDSDEPCPSLSGYELYLNNNQPTVIPTNLGKTSGDSLTKLCSLDTISPDISGVGFSLYAATASITWTTDEMSDSQVEYGTTTSYGNLSSLNPTLQTSHNELLSGLLQYTTYHYRVLSRDAAGNRNKSGDYTFTTADTTPPSLTASPVSSVNEKSASVTWVTDEPADSQVYYGLTSSYGQQTTLDTTKVIPHSQTITGLTSNTTYHFQVRTRDAFGNLTQTPDQTFTTLPDLTPPTISGVSTFVSGTNLTINWTTDEPATSQVGYGIAASYGSQSTLDPSLVLTHSVTVTGLTSNALYYFHLLSSDASSNLRDSGTLTVNTVDVTPPVISSIAVSGITYEAATIGWTTDEGSTTQIQYGTTTAYGNVSTIDPSYVTSHSQIINGLAFSTTYHYRILTRDSSGNTSVSTDQTFTTLTTVSGVSSTNVTDTAMTINWTTVNLSNSQVQYGTTPAMGSLSTLDPVMRTTGHTVTLTGLLPNTLYYLQIQSVDSQSNMATFSRTVTTAADVTAPVITGSYWLYTNTTSPVFEWSTNENADMQVDYGPTVAYGTTTTLVSALTLTHYQYFSGIPPNQTLFYRIRSKDASGNTVSSAGSVYIDTVGPVLGLPPTITGSNGNSATVNWTTNENSYPSVDFGTTTSYGSSVSFTWQTPAQTVALNGILTPNTLYHYRVNSKDVAGNVTTSGDYTFTSAADTTPPVLTGTYMTNLNTSSPYIQWNTNELSDTQVEYGPTASYGSTTTLNATLATFHSTTFSGLTMNTWYHYRLRSRDAAGNLGVTADATFYTNNIPPVFNTPVVSNITSTTATVSWTMASTPPPGVGYYFNGYYGLTAGSSTWTWAGGALTASLTGLTNNTTYHYQILVRDGANSVMTPDFTFSTDVTPPVISAVASSSIADTSASIAWTTNESSNTQIDYGTTTAYGSSTSLVGTMSTSHSQNLSGLTPYTQYHYRVKSRDAAGNLALSADQVFTTTDTVAPVLSSIAVNVTSDTTATITWTTNENSDTQADYGLSSVYTSTSTLAPALATSHSVSISGLSRNTTYHYRAKSRDAAGNLGVSADATFTTTNSAPPVLSAVFASNIIASSATITWTTDETADSQVEYGTTTSYGSSTTLDATSVNSHSQNLTGLTSNTLYHYRVKSRDTAGNLATGTDNTFTTPPDATPPVITNVLSSTNLGAATATITWTTDKGATSQVEYGLTVGYGTLNTKDATLLTSHSQTLSGLMTNTQYHFRVRSIDTNNNESISNDFTFTITDTVPPIISAGPTVPAVTATTATVQWTTDKSSTTQVEYGLTTAYDLYLIDSSFVTVHSYTVPSLLVNTTYHFRVKSRDAGGNAVYSGDSTFTTDGTPPVISAISAGSITTTSATISWTTNEGSTSQVFYGTSASYNLSTVKNASLVTTHAMNLTGLTRNTTYHYRVDSTDAAQNPASSTDQTFTTGP